MTDWLDVTVFIKNKEGYIIFISLLIPFYISLVKVSFLYRYEVCLPGEL